jgi:DNA-binding CsgD family transcriptional regulator
MTAQTISVNGVPPVNAESRSFSDRRVRTTDRRQQGSNDRRGGGRNANGSSEDLYLSRLRDANLCTDRELEIVRLLRNGMTNKQIAQQLDIREDTVKKHLQHVYAKLGVHRRSLLILGRDKGLNARPPR